MPSVFATTRLAPRWLHAWAVLTACATVVLLAAGAVVTTFQVGMADPIWPTMPWHLAFIDWHEQYRGYLIEHSHRLAGYLVGCCVIVLTIGLLASAQRTWLKGLGVLALAGVIVQGLFGGYRVRLHERYGIDLAIVHGCFAQLVFSLFVSLAVLTSPRFAESLAVEEAPRLRRWSLILTGAVLLQLIWGALVRHTNTALAQRLHLFTAFAVVAVAVWFARTALATPSARRILGRAFLVLAGLLVVQVMLGIESWLGKFAGVALPQAVKPTVAQATIRVAHVLVGAFIFAASVILTVLAHCSFGTIYRFTQNEKSRADNLVTQLEETT